MSELLKINVNDHTEKKNGLAYLSWAWAWAEVLKIDAEATWMPLSFAAPNEGLQVLCRMDDGTALVGVSVTIKGKTQRCMLPVMDHKNKAIPKPNAFDVNKAQMRCLAKAIAMHGLGLYIYAGEDLPEGDEADAKPAHNLKAVGVIKPTDGAGKGLSDERKSVIEECASYMIDCHRNGKDMDAIRVWYAPDSFDDNDERIYCWSLLATESKLRSTIKANKPEAEKAA